MQADENCRNQGWYSEARWKELKRKGGGGKKTGSFLLPALDSKRGIFKIEAAALRCA